MMDKFIELLKSKAEEQKGKPKRKGEMEAKASMAKELSSMLGDSVLEDIKGSMPGAKKVTVASNSEKGLKEGLQKAEDILEKKSMEESEPSEEESPEEMKMHGEEEEYSEPEHKIHRKMHGKMGMEEDSDESMSELKNEIEMLKQELENLKKR